MRNSQLTLGRQPMFFFGCSLTTSYPEAPVCHIKKYGSLFRSSRIYDYVRLKILKKLDSGRRTYFDRPIPIVYSN